jgi:hypothetical protein
VPRERLDRNLRQVDGARRLLRLRFSPLEPPTHLDDLLVDPERPLLDVDVVALDGDKLRPPKRGIGTEQRKGSPPLREVRGDGLQLPRLQDADAGAIRLGRSDARGRFLPIRSSSSARFRGNWPTRLISLSESPQSGR